MDPIFAFLVGLFGAACLLLVAPALRRPSGSLEFPFAAGCGLLGFLFPQAVGVASQGDAAPRDGVAKALIMCTLLALAVYAGWHEPAPARWSAPRQTRYPVRRLYWIGMVALAVGLAGFLKLASLGGGILGYYSPHGVSDWRGAPVVFDFFAQYLTPGLVLCGLAGLILGSKLRLLPPAAALAVQLAGIVFLGRRSMLVSVLMSVGCLLYFGSGWVPRRRLVLCAAPLVALAMFIAPEYRKHSQIGGDTERLRDLDSAALIGAGTHGGEFWAMANYIHATAEDNLYEYGTGVYNIFVQLFVPKLIVGEPGKAAMMIPTRDALGGWRMPYGMVPTGAGSAYRKFWFLGCLWFYALSRLMRYLWLRASAGGDRMAQVGYVLLLTPAVASVVNDMYAIYVPIFMFWIPLSVLTCGHTTGQRVRPGTRVAAEAAG
jgi:hypothetical protein